MIWPEPCARIFSPTQHADGNRCGVVDLGDLHGLALVLPELLGVAEEAERDDRDVDVAVGACRVDHRWGDCRCRARRSRSTSTDLAPAAAASARWRRPCAGGRAGRRARPGHWRCAGSARRSPGRSRRCRRAAGSPGGCRSRRKPSRAAPVVGPCRRRTPRRDPPCGAGQSTRRCGDTWRGRSRRWFASPWRCRAVRRTRARACRVR